MVDAVDSVLAPATRMALKLHLDLVSDPEEYDDVGEILSSIEDYEDPKSPLR